MSVQGPLERDRSEISASWVRLVDETLETELTITADQWRLLVAVGSGRAVRAVGDRVGLCDADVRRSLEVLVDAGLVRVEVRASRSADPATPDAPLWGAPVSSWGIQTGEAIESPASRAEILAFPDSSVDSDPPEPPVRAGTAEQDHDRRPRLTLLPPIRE